MLLQNKAPKFKWSKFRLRAIIIETSTTPAANLLSAQIEIFRGGVWGKWKTKFPFVFADTRTYLLKELEMSLNEVQLKYLEEVFAEKLKANIPSKTRKFFMIKAIKYF